MYKKLYALSLMVAMTLSVLSCTDSGNGDDDNIFDSNGDGVFGAMTATINGSSFSSSTAAGFTSVEESGMQISGYGVMGQDSLVITFTLTSPSQGTFELGGDDNDTAHAMIINYSNFNSYFTDVEKATGSIEIEKLTGDEAEGKFAFTAYTVQNDSVIVSNGSFDVELLDENSF